MSCWKLLILAIALHRQTPELTLKELRVGEWLLPDGEALLYRPSELTQVNQQLRRQAEHAHAEDFPIGIRDRDRGRPGARYGWMVATTDCVARPGVKITRGQPPPPEYMTTLRLNQPVRILRSARIDGAEWDEIATADVTGWVPSTTVARLSRRAAKRLSLYRKRLTVIAPEVILPPDVRLPMGAPLHLLAVNRRRGYYTVLLPARATDGTLQWRDFPVNAALVGADLDRHQFYPGLVPFTRNNWIRLGFRFLGTPWALGGSSPGSVDCSGLITSLADAVGLGGLARHSGIQARQGKVLWTRSNPAERLSGLLADGAPAPLLLAKEGHVALYLGERHGAHWILHAVKDLGTIISTLDLKDLDHTFTTAVTF